ncbi:hypothetical protein [Superficieibacter sp. HKU1]|uniref:hypothetical protein n=1 Tax=Superficieibacter sp. HKU1 TaxID=3031919 RepID=UPI0023E0C0EE|nr:hypothetical protein [Superficieibacter sp. HKU1]WES69443.1 hypothetical protein P0H77_05440 [Superficieibacter sp. HKU1]
MEVLIFFIESFIAQNRREHWMSLASGKWVKFYSKIDKIDNHLNERCDCIKKNIVENFERIVETKNIKSGFYFDRFSYNELLSPIAFDKIHEDSILVCPKEKVAFYFHHDGWMWYCSL